VEIVPASGSIYGLAFDNSGEYVYFVQGNPTALYRVSLLGGLSTKIVDNLEGNSRFQQVIVRLLLFVHASAVRDSVNTLCLPPTLTAATNTRS
jgi:hypothetical protein